MRHRTCPRKSKAGTRFEPSVIIHHIIFYSLRNQSHMLDFHARCNAIQLSNSLRTFLPREHSLHRGESFGFLTPRGACFECIQDEQARESTRHACKERLLMLGQRLFSKGVISTASVGWDFDIVPPSTQHRSALRRAIVDTV